MLLSTLNFASALIALLPVTIQGINETYEMSSEWVKVVQSDKAMPYSGSQFPPVVPPSAGYKQFHKRSTFLPHPKESQPRLSDDCQLKPVTILHISRAGTKINSRLRPKLYHFLIDSSVSLLSLHSDSSDIYKMMVLIDPDGGNAILQQTEEGLQTLSVSRNHLASDKSMFPNTKAHTPKTYWHGGIKPFSAVNGSVAYNEIPLLSDEKGRPPNVWSAQGIGVETNNNWTLKDPAIGRWVIKVPQWFNSIEITGQSCIDFSYQFLDGITHMPLSQLPTSNTMALISLRVEGYEFVSGLVSLELRNETNNVLQSLNLESYSDDQSQGKLSVEFTVPLQPFYLTLTGLDALKNTFQRQNLQLLSPSQFSLKLLSRASGQLLPRKNYKFVFEISNLETTAESFRVNAFFDRKMYFTADVDKSSLTVEPGALTQVIIVVHVKQYINHFQSSTLIVTVTRTSDHFVKRITQDISGVPEVFLEDHDPPICILSNARSECDDRKPCGQQKWSRGVKVVDSETGVKTTIFLNPEHIHFFNTIHFSYVSRQNRTSQAFLISSCCAKQFTLKVSDMANNVRNCNVTVPTIVSKQILYFTSPTPQGVTRPMNVSWKGVTSSFAVSIMHRTSSLFFKESSSKKSVLQTVSSYTAKLDTVRQRSSWTDEKFATLRTVAIVLGSVGVIAAVVALSVCTVYLCLKMRVKQRMRKKMRRHGTNESDVTMGASWKPKTQRKRPGRVQNAISLNVISGNRFSTRSTALQIDTCIKGSFKDSGYVDSEIGLQETGNNEASRFHVSKICSSDHSCTFDDSSTETFSPFSLPSDPASNAYSRMMDVQKKLEEMETAVHKNWKRNLNECDILYEMGTGDGGNQSQSSKHSINGRFRKEGVHERSPARDRRGKRPVNETGTSLQHSRDSEIVHTFYDSFDCNIGSESIQNRSNTTSIHSSLDGSVGDRSGAYNLILLEEKPSGSPEVKVYRKAALFRNVAVIRTHEGIGLVKSFPARLKKKNHESDAFSAEPPGLQEITNNGPRVRFLSRSTGEMEQIAPKDPSKEFDR